MSVPVKITGVKADPCRYRSSILMPKGGEKCVKLRVGEGGAGKNFPGIVTLITVECEALVAGQFSAKLQIISEGGITTQKISGNVLEEGTYRSFARSRFQVSGAYMLKPSVQRVGKVNPESGGPRILVENSSVNSLLSHVEPHTADTADPHLVPGPPPCPTADAVLRILGEEEQEELAELPTMSGVFWDRATEELKFDRATLDSWSVGLHSSLEDVIEHAERTVDERNTSLEKKGLVTDRVLRRLRSSLEDTQKSITLVATGEGEEEVEGGTGRA